MSTELKNIINEKPTDELHGRNRYVSNFVDDVDVKNRRILDVGCGFGWFMLNLLGRNIDHITGIEISEKDLETAKKYLNGEKINFQVGSAVDIPFENKTFDTVVAWEVLEHIPKNTEIMMFREVNRVLKFNGVFYLSTPNDSFFSKVLDPAWWLIGHRHYSQEKLIYFAESNGFKVEKVVLRGGWWEIVGMLNMYFAKWIFRRQAFFEHFVSKMQDNEYKKEIGFTNVFIKMRKLKETLFLL